MKKLLYIAPVIIDLKRLNGVSKKVLNHYKIFSEYYDVEMLSYGPGCLYHFYKEKVDVVDLEGLNRRVRLYLFLRKVSNDKIGYDYIYIRYHLSDFYYLYILSLLRKITSKIVIEIPTFPYDRELLKSKNGLVRWFVDVASRLFLKYYVRRIVTYSNDSSIYGIKTINTINGIIYNDILKIDERVYSNSEISLISVSVTQICHGYDRVIEGLNNYYKKTDRSVVVKYHLVGDGSEIERYKKMIEKYQLQKYVFIYGFKEGRELDKIYNYADIAINSIGIHRIGLEPETTLIAKEYAAKGLPMISSYNIDVFNQEDNDRYVLRVSADDAPIDIENVVRFYIQLYCNKEADISEEIRRVSQKKCDMITTLKGVVEYFDSKCLEL